MVLGARFVVVVFSKINSLFQRISGGNYIVNAFILFIVNQRRYLCIFFVESNARITFFFSILSTYSYYYY